MTTSPSGPDAWTLFAAAEGTGRAQEAARLGFGMWSGWWSWPWAWLGGFQASRLQRDRTNRRDRADGHGQHQRPVLRRDHRSVHLRLEDRQGMGGELPSPGREAGRQHHQDGELPVHQVASTSGRPLTHAPAAPATT